MRICIQLGVILSIIVGVLRVGQIAAFSTQENRSPQQDRAAIERLHQQDVQATLSGKADDFATLWDKDAVRLLPGSPAEIGRLSGATSHTSNLRMPNRDEVRY
jgi:hypothetical protein